MAENTNHPWHDGPAFLPDASTGLWGATALGNDPLPQDQILDIVQPKDFDYFTTDVSKLEAVSKEVEDNTGMKRWVIQSLTIGGEQFKPTDRFMTSLMAKFGFAQSVLSYFSPEELFERIDLRHPNTDLRLTTHKDEVLAVSDPSKAIMDASTLPSVFEMADLGTPLSLSWNGTHFASVHSVPEHPFDCFGETFEPRFVMFTPIDGYGKPAAYLTVLRHRCLNTLLAYAKPFRTEVNLGKGDSPAEPMVRFLDAFNNEDGFVALQNRLDSANHTAASVHNVATLRKAMIGALRASNDEQALLSTSHTRLFTALTSVTGDISAQLQVGSDQWIPPKRQKQINVGCTVADLMNVATELVSHHAVLLDNPKALMDWTGKLVIEEYDLEGVDIGDYEDIKVRDGRERFYLPMDLSSKVANEDAAVLAAAVLAAA